MKPGDSPRSTSSDTSWILATGAEKDIDSYSDIYAISSESEDERCDASLSGVSSSDDIVHSKWNKVSALRKTPPANDRSWYLSLLTCLCVAFFERKTSAQAVMREYAQLITLKLSAVLVAARQRTQFGLYGSSLNVARISACFLGIATLLAFAILLMNGTNYSMVSRREARSTEWKLRESLDACKMPETRKDSFHIYRPVKSTLHLNRIAANIQSCQRWSPFLSRTQPLKSFLLHPLAANHSCRHKQNSFWKHAARLQSRPQHFGPSTLQLSRAYRFLPNSTVMRFPRVRSSIRGIDELKKTRSHLISEGQIFRENHRELNQSRVIEFFLARAKAKAEVHEKERKLEWLKMEYGMFPKLLSKNLAKLAELTNKTRSMTGHLFEPERKKIRNTLYNTIKSPVARKRAELREAARLHRVSFPTSKFAELRAAALLDRSSIKNRKRDDIRAETLLNPTSIHTRKLAELEAETFFNQWSIRTRKLAELRAAALLDRSSIKNRKRDDIRAAMVFNQGSIHNRKRVELRAETLLNRASIHNIKQAEMRAETLLNRVVFNQTSIHNRKRAEMRVEMRAETLLNRASIHNRKPADLRLETLLNRASIHTRKPAELRVETLLNRANIHTRKPSEPRDETFLHRRSIHTPKPAELRVETLLNQWRIRTRKPSEPNAETFLNRASIHTRKLAELRLETLLNRASNRARKLSEPRAETFLHRVISSARIPQELRASMFLNRASIHTRANLKAETFLNRESIHTRQQANLKAETLLIRESIRTRKLAEQHPSVFLNRTSFATRKLSEIIAAMPLNRKSFVSNKENQSFPTRKFSPPSRSIFSARNLAELNTSTFLNLTSSLTRRLVDLKTAMHRTSFSGQKPPTAASLNLTSSGKTVDQKIEMLLKESGYSSFKHTSRWQPYRPSKTSALMPFHRANFPFRRYSDPFTRLWMTSTLEKFEARSFNQPHKIRSTALSATLERRHLWKMSSLVFDPSFLRKCSISLHGSPPQESCRFPKFLIPKIMPSTGTSHSLTPYPLLKIRELIKEPDFVLLERKTSKVKTLWELIREKVKIRELIRKPDFVLADVKTSKVKTLQELIREPNFVLSDGKTSKVKTLQELIRKPNFVLADVKTSKVKTLQELIRKPDFVLVDKKTSKVKTLQGLIRNQVKIQTLIQKPDFVFAFADVKTLKVKMPKVKMPKDEVKIPTTEKSPTWKVYVPREDQHEKRNDVASFTEFNPQITPGKKIVLPEHERVFRPSVLLASAQIASSFQRGQYRRIIPAAKKTDCGIACFKERENNRTMSLEEKLDYLQKVSRPAALVSSMHDALRKDKLVYYF